MSIPGGAVGIRQPPPQSWPACWAELAQHVARASRDLLHTSMDAIDSAVNVPLAASSAGSTFTGTSDDLRSSNDPAPEKLPPPPDNGADDAADIDPEHAATWALVRAAQRGDGEAFGKLYDRYVDAVYRFVYYRVNDRALAEDFTSETFLRALRRIASINYQGRDIGAWFITIARNIVFDHAKSARYRLELTTGDILEGDDVDAGPEYLVLANLTNVRLLEAVNSLGEEQKECIVLRFLNGLSVAETATVMGKNDGAIKALQHRAVKRLASVLGDELR
ncbi:sigma-70 family RNA polymerase sigma factor [Jatrophihabitans sp.]|uniref:sigma-70 family RNA polymerase sigma factor n=1 Tax=Jatrophihabitans sp. TaxID=1932789 RepID=UPI002B8E349C|nr:sigma-70 family RNA polymerase sigma factor [Jatrophihabitans sp.]